MGEPTFPALSHSTQLSTPSGSDFSLDAISSYKLSLLRFHNLLCLLWSRLHHCVKLPEYLLLFPPLKIGGLNKVAEGVNVVKMKMTSFLTVVND